MNHPIRRYITNLAGMAGIYMAGFCGYTGYLKQAIATHKLASYSYTNMMAEKNNLRQLYEELDKELQETIITVTSTNSSHVRIC